MKNLLYLFALITISCKESETIIKTEYYENKNKKSEYTYINNSLHGPFKIWKEDGELKEKGFYKNGKKDSIWIKYDLQYVRNKKDSIIEWYKQDSLVRRHLFEPTPWNGAKSHEEITVYLNGNKYDTSTSWHISTGKLKRIYTSKNDNTDGFDKWYHENGNPSSEDNYKSRRKHGRSVEWDSLGNVIKEEYYNMGELIKKVK